MLARAGGGGGWGGAVGGCREVTIGSSLSCPICPHLHSFTQSPGYSSTNKVALKYNTVTAIETKLSSFLEPF